MLQHPSQSCYVTTRDQRGVDLPTYGGPGIAAYTGGPVNASGQAPCPPMPPGAIPPPGVIDPCAPRKAITIWKVNYMVSNRPCQAAHLDQNLVDPWGIAIYNNQIWVVCNYTDYITNYNMYGNRLLGPVSTRDNIHDATFPTGIAINCGAGFVVTNGNFSRSGTMLTVSEMGTVAIYNPEVNNLNSYPVYNHQLTAEVAKYKGVAIAHGLLYLPDFFHRRVLVFDSNFNRLPLFQFVDGDSSDPIPLDFGPVNIVHIGKFLYLVWAQRDPVVTIHNINGPGLGYISVFNLDGSFVKRFTSRGHLNNPWAIIPAPCEVGFPPGSFLVSNHGDGRTLVFDDCGKYVGPLLNQNGLPMVIVGLRGLAPYYTSFNEIFFTAAYQENVEGLVGSFVRDQVIYF